MSERPLVSVIVVSFNTRDKLRRCLAAIEREHEVIVVDNDSADGSAEMVESEFPHVKLIRNESNFGFGAANNAGLAAMSGRLALFLNSDCYAEPGAIAMLALSFQDDRIVAAGAKLLNPDGSLQQSCANELTLWAVFCEQTYLERLFPRSRILSPYWMSARLPEGGEVAQCMGACLMIRPIEKFDVRFFLYCEDTDICFRLRRHGIIRYSTEAVFTHELGSSSSERWKAVARYNWGKQLFFLLRHGPLQSAACFLLNRFGAMLRMIIWLAPSALTLFAHPFPRSRALLFARVLIAPVNPDLAHQKRVHRRARNQAS